jgi:hypothetical protein
LLVLFLRFADHLTLIIENHAPGAGCSLIHSRDQLGHKNPPVQDTNQLLF